MGDTILDRAMKGERVRVDRWTLMTLILLLSKITVNAQWLARLGRYDTARARHRYDASIDCRDVEEALQDLVDTALGSLGLKAHVRGHCFCVVERATA